MMNHKQYYQKLKAVLLCGMLLASIATYAQIGGNASYGNNHRNEGYKQNQQLVYVNDSTIKISARVLMNFDADRYMAVWGLQEEGETPEICNQQLEKKIKAFKSTLKSQFKIEEQSVYVDMVSQAPVYNHEIAGKVISQKQTGFELKKNIIHTFNDVEQLDEMLMAAAGLEVYDLIKVDYLVEDQLKVRQQLYATACDILAQKQQSYEQLIGKNFGKPMAIHSENFYLVQPLIQYASYTAEESSHVQTSYNSDYVKKNARKRTTFYYDGMNGSGYDQVISPSKIKVGMQAVIELSVLFRIK